MTARHLSQLRRDALGIWQAGLEAVRSDRLVREAMRVENGELIVGDEVIDLAAIRRIAVVGAGKAGAGMADAALDVLGNVLIEAKRVHGWVNVPGDCVPRGWRGPVHLHAARPAGMNEPTEEALAGTEEILRRVSALTADDLCLCLLSGGGSAMLPAPPPGLMLDDLKAVGRALSAAGATIEEMNCVRRRLSRALGGGLAAACRAGRLVSLIISDVPGDPLEAIASGPTTADPTTAEDALAVLEKYRADETGVRKEVFDYLRRPAASRPGFQPDTVGLESPTYNLVIGNNATAVDAAGREAARRGYAPAMISASRPEGPAEEVAAHLAGLALQMKSRGGIDCLVSGGEPTVKLAPPELRGRGGRNQQLALAAAKWLEDADGVVLLSGGTDGEDGPTDAAGAIVDAETIAQAKNRGMVPDYYLERNDAYNFFAPLGSLLKTGPTHTNVGDLRVVVVS